MSTLSACTRLTMQLYLQMPPSYFARPSPRPMPELSSFSSTPSTRASHWLTHLSLEVHQEHPLVIYSSWPLVPNQLSSSPLLSSRRCHLRSGLQTCTLSVRTPTAAHPQRPELMISRGAGHSKCSQVGQQPLGWGAHRRCCRRVRIRQEKEHEPSNGSRRSRQRSRIHLCPQRS